MAKLKSCIKVLAARDLHGCNSPSFPKDSPTSPWKVPLTSTNTIITTPTTVIIIVIVIVIIATIIIIMIFAGCAG